MFTLHPWVHALKSMVNPWTQPCFCQTLLAGVPWTKSKGRCITHPQMDPFWILIESWPINTRLVTSSIQIGFLAFHPANGCKWDDDSNGRTYVSGGLKPPTYTRQNLGTRAILWIAVCNITVHPIAGGTVNSFDVPMFVRYISYSK
jgi:hypothetical protein